MSTKRTKPGGWVDLATLPRNEHGVVLCRRCERPVPPGRRTFCGAACVHEWKVRTNSGYARQKVWERDQGICAECGVDAAASHKAAMQKHPVYEYRARIGGNWQADHKVPVVEGGGECGLDNLRTLCHACHLKATRELRARLKAKRLAERRQTEIDL